MEVQQLQERHQLQPGLAVVLVGRRKDSATYVRMKRRACEDIGILSVECVLGEDATEEEVVELVGDLNSRQEIHGILVQLPLPEHMDQQVVLAAICESKDADGFTTRNVGAMALGLPHAVLPCTPAGVMELLRRYGVGLRGKRAVVLGRSAIVGMPLAQLLQQHDATVTVCHSYTKHTRDLVREADVVVAAMGIPEMVRGDWIKQGAVVVDVGINYVEEPGAERGYRLCGDVLMEEAEQSASLITPVPGGVGPMTIAMLMSNTVLLAKRSIPQAT